MWKAGRWRPFIYWFTLQTVTTAEVGQASEGRMQKLHSDFPCGNKSPKYLVHLPPTFSSMWTGIWIQSGVAQTWTLTYVGCWCHMQWVNLMCHNTSPKLDFSKNCHKIEVMGKMPLPSLVRQVTESRVTRILARFSTEAVEALTGELTLLALPMPYWDLYVD